MVLVSKIKQKKYYLIKGFAIFIPRLFPCTWFFIKERNNCSTTMASSTPKTSTDVTTTAAPVYSVRAGADKRGQIGQAVRVLLLTNYLIMNERVGFYLYHWCSQNQHGTRAAPVPC